MKFMDLTEEVLDLIIDYLPQQSVINLSLTNYRYYNPCNKKLYKKLLISPDPIQETNAFTAISGFSYTKLSKLYTPTSQLRLVNARLSILQQSLEVNEALIKNLQEIHVFIDEHDDEFVDNLQYILISLISSGITLEKLFVNNLDLRSKLDTKLLKLKSGVIDRTINRGLNEVVISGFSGIQDLLASDLLENVHSLILPSNEQVYWKIINTILQRQTKFHFKSFKLVFNNENFKENVYLTNLINWDLIENLEIHLGSPNKNENLIDLLQLVPIKRLKNLKRFSFVQSKLYDLHVMNEQFDYIIFDFINDLVNVCSKFTYLSIEHNLPLFGNFDDGVEGNYFRRKKMYTDLLPKILSKSKNYFELSLPNLFQTLACYEQPMNTLIWNGCKCSHCKVYLEYLDNYMMHHRYYNQSQNGYKDLNCSSLLITIGYALNQRSLSDNLLTNLRLNHYPLRDVLYDFHSTPSGVSNKCYDDEIIDHGLFDESEPVNPNELHNAARKPCKFNQKMFYNNYTKVVSHYLDKMLAGMLNLDRGNAEEETVGDEMNDDKDYNISIKKLTINSIEYSIKQERNGTYFFTAREN